MDEVELIALRTEALSHGCEVLDVSDAPGRIAGAPRRWACLQKGVLEDRQQQTYGSASAAWLARALELGVVGRGTKAPFATEVMRLAFPDGPSFDERRGGADRGRMDPETVGDVAVTAEARLLGYMPLADRREVCGYAYGRTLDMDDVGRHPTMRAAWIAAVTRAALADQAPLARQLALSALREDATALTPNGGEADPVDAALHRAVDLMDVVPWQREHLVAELRELIARRKASGSGATAGSARTGNGSRRAHG